MGKVKVVFRNADGVEESAFVTIDPVPAIDGRITVLDISSHSRMLDWGLSRTSGLQYRATVEFDSGAGGGGIDGFRELHVLGHGMAPAGVTFGEEFVYLGPAGMAAVYDPDLSVVRYTPRPLVKVIGTTARGPAVRAASTRPRVGVIDRTSRVTVTIPDLRAGGVGSDTPAYLPYGLIPLATDPLTGLVTRPPAAAGFGALTNFLEVPLFRFSPTECTAAIVGKTRYFATSFPGMTGTSGSVILSHSTGGLVALHAAGLLTPGAGVAAAVAASAAARPAPARPKPPDDPPPVAAVRVGRATYRLQKPAGWRFVRRRPGRAGRFEVAGFEGLAVGRGRTAEAGRRDWENRLHARFQELYHLQDFERTPNQQAAWDALARLIDVEAYRRSDSVVGREIGRVVRTRRAGKVVEWQDGHAELVRYTRAPAGLAGAADGTWLAATVARHPDTYKLRRVLWVEAHTPWDGTLDAAHRAKLDRTPTTTTLPETTW